MITLRPYQQEGVTDLSVGFAKGVKSQIFQLATGGGKTITFCAIVDRYIQRSRRKVVIAVHRDELMKQARTTLFKHFGIVAEIVGARQRNINFDAKVFITMVETASRRLTKQNNFFGDVGMLIIDECHIGNFKKLYEHFDGLRIGFTATPISASKKKPLKEDWEQIVCGIDIPDLIKSGNLMPNRTYHIKNMNRESLKVSRGEFNDRFMGQQFSTGKHIENCINAYKKYAYQQKTIVFNCNVDHSLLVTKAFQEHGIDARHLDGKTSKTERTQILQWLRETPDAVLCNVGVLTTGFDEPSLRTVIVNKSTMSLPLWLQMTGRGSRPHPQSGKDSFDIIDLGGNALVHGDWSDPRDWEALFMHPDKPSNGGGVAPTKSCPECESIIHASASHCNFCGHQFKVDIAYDEEEIDFELLVSNIDVAQRIDHYKNNNEYYTLHSIKQTFIKETRSQVKEMTDEIAYKLLDAYLDKVGEWCKIKGKRYDDFHKRVPTEWLFKELKKYYSWEPQKLSLAI